MLLSNPISIVVCILPQLSCKPWMVAWREAKPRGAAGRSNPVWAKAASSRPPRALLMLSQQG